jgi:hypothetical protein
MQQLSVQRLVPEPIYAGACFENGLSLLHNTTRSSSSTSDMSISHESPYSSRIGAAADSPLVSQDVLPCSVLRLFDCRHLHCTGTAIRVSRMSCGPGRCAQGSPGRCGCARCRQARPAAVVRARTHTSIRAQRHLRSAHTQLAQLPYPPAPPRPVLPLNTVSDS